MMTGRVGKRLSYHIGCMKSLRNLPDHVAFRFMTMAGRYMFDSFRHELKLEMVDGAQDSAIKFLHIDKRYRAIACAIGRDVMFLHVNEHEKASSWAAGRRVKLDPMTNRVRVINGCDATAVPIVTSAAPVPHLFMHVADKQLCALGVLEEELPAIRTVRSLEALEAGEEDFDPLTYQVLYAVAIGYTDDEVNALTGMSDQSQTALHRTERAFDTLIVTEESRQTIFIPETQDDLRRALDADLSGWEIFLHPVQRKLAYQDYDDPVLVLGGAGTGKTVVAMHRAKHLADQIKADPSRSGERVLLTTFTANAAKILEANLRLLCPEHLDALPSRIEVISLDLWAAHFLKRRNHAREIVFFGEARERLDQLWQDVFVDHALPEGVSETLVKAEWTQIVQAKGVIDLHAYLKIPRTGRGTALDRHKRAALWQIFEDYRARMILLQLAEPDDAYRDAIEILSAEPANLPYAAVIVDEAQEMGEQAFRLIRAIIPQAAERNGKSIFIVGDAHQRIHRRRAIMSACGINIRGHSRRLRLNYRTTQEIGAWAISVVKGVPVDNLDGGTDTLQDHICLTHGAEPELVECLTEAEELSGIAAWIHSLSADEVQLSDIAVLCARRADVDRVRDALRMSGIHTMVLPPRGEDETRQTGVRITTMQRAKGLEFLAVAIPFLSATSFPPGDAFRSAADAGDWEDIITQYRALLHVAATRAKKILRLSWSGAPTGLIQP